MTRIGVQIHDTTGDCDALTVGYNPDGVECNSTPYFTVRIGFMCDLFITRERLAELRDVISAALEAHSVKEQVAA